jgi:hypothetical protein
MLKIRMGTLFLFGEQKISKTIFTTRSDSDIIDLVTLVETEIFNER